MVAATPVLQVLGQGLAGVGLAHGLLAQCRSQGAQQLGVTGGGHQAGSFGGWPFLLLGGSTFSR